MKLPQRHDLELERDVIGSALLRPETVDVSELTEDDFYSDAHRLTWIAIHVVHNRGEEVSTGSVRSELLSRGQLDRVGGVDFLLGLTDTIPRTGDASVRSSARRLRSYARLRGLAETMVKLAGEMESAEEPEGWLDWARSRLEAALDAGEQLQTCRHIGEIAKDVYTGLNDRDSGRGLSTGFSDLDRRLGGGLRPGQLMVVAGRPGMGKSAFAAQMAAVASARSPVVFFSLEMPAEELAQRYISSLGMVHAGNLREKNLDATQWQRAAAACKAMTELKLFVEDEHSMTLSKVRSRSRMIARKHGGMAAVFIDYLQLLKAEGFRRDSREAEVAEISRALKGMAKELKCPVVALAQLNREVEKRSDRRPLMSDLRESGAIEQDADIIAFLYRDEAYDPFTEDKGIAEAIIRKQRGGPTGTVRLRWTDYFTRFESLEDGRHVDI